MIRRTAPKVESQKKTRVGARYSNTFLSKSSLLDSGAETRGVMELVCAYLIEQVSTQGPTSPNQI